MINTRHCLKPLLGITMLLAAASVQARSYNASENYANPDAVTTNQYRNNPCSDPWVALALNRVYGRADAAYCATGLYNGGQWRDFNELVHAVERTRISMQQQGISFRVMPVQGLNRNAVIVFQSGRMVAAGGGNMVAAGGGNMVAAGGGNVLVNNGGNMVAAGGGNFVGNAGGNVLPVARVSGGYSVMSGRGVSLPKGSLVFE